jgi:type I restriction enzyme, S subunit
VANYGKSAAVPRLRFAEFRDAWELKPLAPYLEECGYKVAAKTSLPIYSSSRSGLIPQASYYDGRTIINDGEYGVVPPDCFVYRHMSDDGKFAFNLNETGSEIAVSKEYPVFRTVDLDPKFLFAKLNDSLDFKAFALSQKAGGTRTRLYFSKLRAWETFLPPRAEQKKIADCLTSLDEVIATQRRKVEALKIFKRGLMQQLFPREGETLPRLRFPEFSDAPEWEERQLDTCFSHIRNGFVGTATPFYVAGGSP